MAASPLNPMSRQRRRVRRRTMSAATSMLPFALVLSAALAQANGNDQHDDNDSQHQQQQQQRRRLHSQKAETLTKWRSLQIEGSGGRGLLDLSKLRPLDLVLDETDTTHQRVYQKGDGGFLEPYDFENYQEHSVGVIHLGGSLNNGDGSANNGGGSAFATSGLLQEERNVHHKTSSRLGLTNFDLHRGIGVENDQEEDETTTERRTQTRNLRGLVVENEQQQASSIFMYTEANDPQEMEHYEIMDEDLLHPQPDDRRLQSESGYSHDKSSTSAQSFVKNEPIQKKQRQDTSPPIIRTTFPPVNTAIGAHQTFGALVKDNGSGVKNVCLQLKDHENSRSECFPLENVGGPNYIVKNSGGSNKNKNDQQREQQEEQSEIWELSIQGFELYAGRTWQFRIKSTDGARNRKSTPWRAFVIDERAAGAGGGQSGEQGGGQEATTTSSTMASATTTTTSHRVDKLMQEVKDELWPHGGVVQSSTGRILFFFDSHPYVCTGTVLKTPPNPQNPTQYPSDRTIILTAGHCAYQHQSTSLGGRFAEHALYIPNQVDTRASKSNEVCSDDPLGCWLPAFAVVHYEWTTKGFPQSVPWDYAYYVIPNLEEVHEGGYIHEEQQELSKILEEIVEPMPIDFEWQLRSTNPEDVHLAENDMAPGEFTHGLGYSFNKDPSFQYCATSMTTKFGINSYENYWLPTCEMTGGSSGGPWLKDTDSDGRGTVISINSWGYASAKGMAGPNFNTGEGGKAECLLEVAMNTRFEDLTEGQRGVVVNDC